MVFDIGEEKPANESGIGGEEVEAKSINIELISNIEELVIMLKRASETASQLQREIEEINNFRLEIGTRSVKT